MPELFCDAHVVGEPEKRSGAQTVSFQYSLRVMVPVCGFAVVKQDELPEAIAEFSTSMQREFAPST